MAGALEEGCGAEGGGPEAARGAGGWQTAGGVGAVEPGSSSSDEEFADALEVLVDEKEAAAPERGKRPEAGVRARPRNVGKESLQFHGPTFRTAAQAVAAGVRLRQGQNRRLRLRVMPNPPLRRTADVQGAAFILYAFTVQQWQRGVSAANAWQDVHQLSVRYSSARTTDRQLRKLLSAGVLESFPDFPPPRHFSDNLTDEENIKRRFEELRVYYCRVLATPAVLRSEEAFTLLGLKDLYVAPVPHAKRDPSKGPRIKPCPELIDATVPPASANAAIKSVRRRRRRPTRPSLEVHDETASSDGGSQNSGQRPPRPLASDATTPGLRPSPMVAPLRFVDQAIEWRHQARQLWAPVQDDPEYQGSHSEDPDAALQLQWARPRSRSARAAEGARGGGRTPSIKSAPNTPVKGRDPSSSKTDVDEGWHLAGKEGARSAAFSAPGSGSRSPISDRARSGSSVCASVSASRSTATDGTDGDAYVAELEKELAGGAAACRAWVVADECAAAGYGTAARRAAIFKAMAEEFPPPRSSGRFKAPIKPGTNPRVAQAEFEDLLSHPFEWVVMAYMYRMNINDLGDDVNCKVVSPTPEEMAAGRHGNAIEYDLRLSIPYGVQLVAKRAELPLNERAVFDIENRTLKTFVTLELWNDSIGFLEYVEYRAVSPHETYFRKGIIVELAHPRFPPQWVVELCLNAYLSRSKECMPVIESLASTVDPNHPKLAPMLRFLDMRIDR